MLDKTIEYFKSSAESLNENKYFIGFAMILLNIGARFIIDELDDDTRSLISYPYVRRFFVFCSFFMATRDIFKALILTIIFVIIVTEVLNDDDDEEENLEENKTNKDKINEALQLLSEVKNDQDSTNLM